MKQKAEVQQGTLALMVLKTLDLPGALHGYGMARRIEQEGAIESEWGAPENSRQARVYRLTREGRRQLQVETKDRLQATAIIARFFEVKAEILR